MPDLTDPTSPRDHTPWGTILRNVALVLVLLSMLWLAFNIRLPELSTLQAEIAELGAWGALAFVALMLAIDGLVLRPWERRASRWRRDAA